MRLTTEIFNSTNQPVNYKVYERRAEVFDSWRYEIIIHVNNDAVGYMKYSIQKNSLYIHRMDNYSLRSTTPYKQVGSLLFEYAFNKSLELGMEGRIELDAIERSPAAYFTMGLRKKGIGALFLAKEISAFKLTKSPAIQSQIESDSFYRSLKNDAQAAALKKGLTSLSFETIIDLGEYSQLNDPFEKRMVEAKARGEQLTRADIMEYHMDGTMYLPDDTIPEKKSAFSFVPIGSRFFYSAHFARSHISNTRLIDLVNEGKLDASNAVEIAKKLVRNPELQLLVDLLLSSLSLKMLERNYISAWFAIMDFSLNSLQLILSDNGMTLFENNHIHSMRELVNVHASCYATLFSQAGVNAFQKGALRLTRSGHLENARGEFVLNAQQLDALVTEAAQEQPVITPQT